MTRKEKQRKIERLEKRLKRFVDWVEYYKSDNFVKLMQCSIKARLMANEIFIIASQKPSELECVGGYNCQGIRIQ